MTVANQSSDSLYCSTTPSTSGTAIRSKLWRIVTNNTLSGGFYAYTRKTEITGSLPDRYYTDIAVDPTDDKRIAVTLSGFNSSHVFLSLDGGNNWTDIGVGLPDIPHNTVTFDPDNRDIIYVGNDQGVYYARDVPVTGPLGGSHALTWVSYNEGLGDGVLVSDIVITHTRKLRLATYGRGLFEREMVPAVPVPVTLLKFEGETNGSHADLNWQTTAELNLDRFEIERSIGSTQNFQKAGTVSARNQSFGILNYQFSDQNIFVTNTSAYYRLKMVDLDGQFKYSPIVQLKTEANTQFVRHLGLAADQTLLVAVGNKSGIRTLHVQIVGINGQTFVHYSGAYSDTRLDLRQLLAGPYVAIITDGSGKEKYVKQFIKNGR
jgi:hypothetical protein